MPTLSRTSTTGFVLRLLAAAVFRYRRRTLLALGLVILAKLAAIGVPLSLKAIVDQLGALPVALTLTLSLVIAYALLRFLGTFFNEVRDMLFVRVTHSTESGFLLQVFAHMHRLSARFHALRGMGGVTRDIERGTAGIGFLIGVGLFTLLPTLVEIVGVIAVMSFNYSGWFTVAILTTFFLYSTFTVVFTERRTIYQRALNELDSSANGRLVDSLLNHETVKYYTNEAFEYRRFSSILDEWVEVGVKNQKALSTLHIGQSSIIACGVATVMLLATQNVVHGTMSVGDLILVNAYLIQICLPLNSLGFIFREARDAVVNVERMLRLLELRPEIEDRLAAPALEVSRGEVRFEHVDFAYDPSRQILKDVDFSIAPGSTVAVVGGSGSGKSTLARLLFRFYEVGAGRITIDGVDIREVSQHSLRNALGIVPQDTILFNDSIAYNIAYSQPDATPAEIVDAAKAAHLHDFIASLPAQYETEVGERGILLSGGEKQRLAIARALLRNPPIMVFDEATSALDSRSERAIQDELYRLAQSRTTLIIAHRLSSVVDADEILVLEQGRIVERGTHLRLLAEDGLYAQLWQLQRQQQEVESTERGMAMQQVDLSRLLGGVVDGLKATLDARGVGFDTALHADAATIAGDPGRLQQILWTLAERAVLASAPGGRVSGRIEPVGGRLRLSLRYQPASDERFDTREIRSTVEQFGGHFELRGASGGSEALLEFPLSPATHRVEAGGPSGGEPALPSIAGARIFIVDADGARRAQREALLSRLGAVPRGFPAGSVLLDHLASLPRDAWPDLMIHELAERPDDACADIQDLRRFETAQGFALAERVPALALGPDAVDAASAVNTASAVSAYPTQVLLAGFQRYLAQPFAPDDLVATIAAVIGGRPPRQRSAPTTAASAAAGGGADPETRSE